MMGFEYCYPKAFPVEEICGSKTRRAATNDCHPLRPPGLLRNRQSRFAFCHFIVSKKTFDAAYGYCLIQHTAAAGVFTGVVTDTSAYPGRGLSSLMIARASSKREAAVSAM